MAIVDSYCYYKLITNANFKMTRPRDVLYNNTFLVGVLKIMDPDSHSKDLEGQNFLRKSSCLHKKKNPFYRVFCDNNNSNSIFINNLTVF